MKLVLLRHAHTEKVKRGMTDFDRNIDSKGFDQIGKLNKFIIDHYSGVNFQVFCSSAQRTRTTFQSIESSLNLDHVSFHDELYLPSRDRLLQFLWNAEQRSENILIVSHNNGISDLATYLLEDSMALPTCGWLEISYENINDLNGISQGLGELLAEYYP